jgi:hypothetical protein
LILQVAASSENKLTKIAVVPPAPLVVRSNSVKSKQKSSHKWPAINLQWLSGAKAQTFEVPGCRG